MTPIVYVDERESGYVEITTNMGNFDATVQGHFAEKEIHFMRTRVAKLAKCDYNEVTVIDLRGET